MAERSNYSEELSAAPLADLIHAVAMAVADGQFRMDKASLRSAEFMSGRMPRRDLDTGQLLTPEGQPTDTAHYVNTQVAFGYHYSQEGERVADSLSMMELGFVPTFYQFVDTVIDMKLTLRLHRQSADSGGTEGTVTTTEQSTGGGTGSRSKGKAKTVITTKPVDARYATSYNFSAEMASRVKTKLVPIPPPPLLEERIRALLDQERQDSQRLAKEIEEQEKRGLARQPLGGPEFDGSSCYEIADLGKIQARLGNALTVEAWVRPKDVPGSPGIVGLGTGGGTGRTGWLLGIFDGQFGLAATSHGAGKESIVKAPGVAAPDRWQHVAATYDGSELRVYVDGRLRNGSGEQSKEIRYADPARLLIGAGESERLGERFKGWIDDVRLWDHARTGAEIKRAMNHRLRGDEAGLVAYWRLDRCKDDTLPDQTAGKHPAKRSSP